MSTKSVTSWLLETECQCKLKRIFRS